MVHDRIWDKGNWQLIYFQGNPTGVKHAFSGLRTPDRWPMLTGSPSRILENLATAVLTFDPRLRLTSINPAGEMLFEISAKKAVGQSLTDLLPHARLAARTLMQTLESQHPFTARSVPLKLPGVRTITVDCTVTPLADT